MSTLTSEEEANILSKPLNKAEDTLVLPPHPTLHDFQQYVIELKKIRGFANIKKNALIMMFNEVGELGQEMMRTWGNEDAISEEARRAIGLEMADIFIYLLDLANQHDISLEQAFREKEEINKRRIWKKHHRAD